MSHLEEVEGIMRDIFANDALSIDRETTADDVPEWDSLTHVELILAVEMHFKVKFKNAEVAQMRDVGDMVDAIERHLGTAS